MASTQLLEFSSVKGRSTLGVALTQPLEYPGVNGRPNLRLGSTQAMMHPGVKGKPPLRVAQSQLLGYLDSRPNGEELRILFHTSMIVSPIEV